jgi:hypothetical protein
MIHSKHMQAGFAAIAEVLAAMAFAPDEYPLPAGRTSKQTAHDFGRAYNDSWQADRHEAWRVASFRLSGPPPNARARQWWLRQIAKGGR